MATLMGRLESRRSDGAPLAGKSTLNRLELSRPLATRYRKISHDPVTIEALLLNLFLEAHARAPSGSDRRCRKAPQAGRHDGETSSAGRDGSRSGSSAPAFRLEDGRCRYQGWGQLIQPDENQPICLPQPEPHWSGSLQDDQAAGGETPSQLRERRAN